MSSDSNKLTLERANAAIVKGDYEGFLVQCTEDTEWVFEGDRTLKGKEAARQWMASVYSEPPKFNVHRVIAEGEFVVALGEIMLKDEQGTPTRHSYCDIWRFDDGRMAELRAFVIKS